MAGARPLAVSAPGSAAQLVDAELGKGAVQVRADGPWGQVQPRGDLLARQAARGQMGDFGLLRGEPGSAIGADRPGAGGTQFLRPARPTAGRRGARRRTTAELMADPVFCAYLTRLFADEIAPLPPGAARHRPRGLPAHAAAAAVQPAADRPAGPAVPAQLHQDPELQPAVDLRGAGAGPPLPVAGAGAGAGGGGLAALPARARLRRGRGAAGGSADRSGAGRAGCGWRRRTAAR